MFIHRYRLRICNIYQHYVLYIYIYVRYTHIPYIQYYIYTGKSYTHAIWCKQYMLYPPGQITGLAAGYSKVQLTKKSCN